MKIDLYSKVVLTVIAGCLVLQTLDRLLPSAEAQQNGRPIKVTVCDVDGQVCADIRRGAYDGLIVSPQ